MFIPREDADEARALVERIWNKHRAHKIAVGAPVPDSTTGDINDAGCGCSCCLYAGYFLHEGSA
jgi:hypothetical protein